jgi:hypothetical protein
MHFIVQSIIHDDKVDHYHSYNIVAILNNIITFGFKNTHVFTSCTCVYVKYDQVMMIIVTFL